MGAGRLLPGREGTVTLPKPGQSMAPWKSSAPPLGRGREAHIGGGWAGAEHARWRPVAGRAVRASAQAGGARLQRGRASPLRLGDRPRSRKEHEGAGEAAPGPAVGAACPAPGPGCSWDDSGRAHLPVAGQGHAGVAGVQPVPPGHLRAAALWPGQPHRVQRVPAAPLHAVLELPGALPLLQRHLRGARGGGAALHRHPQPRLPLPRWPLRARRLLPRARALPAWRRRGRPWHPQPEHAVPAVSPGHLLRQQLQLRAVPAPPQLHSAGPGPQRARLLLPRRPVHQLPGLPAQQARAGGPRDGGV